MPVACQFLDHPHHAWRQGLGARGEDARQLGAQEAQPLPHRNASLQQEGADLTDQPLRHASLLRSGPAWLKPVLADLAAAFAGDQGFEVALDNFCVGAIAEAELNRDRLWLPIAQDPDLRPAIQRRPGAGAAARGGVASGRIA